MVQIYNTHLKEGKPILVEEQKIPAEIHFINNEKELYAFCKDTLKIHLYTEEYMFAIAVNTKSRILGVFEISHGTVNTAFVNPREIMIKLLLIGSVNFFLVHNHPSQDPSPSKPDIDATLRLRQVGQLIGVNLIDHMIITENSYHSINQEIGINKSEDQ